MRPLLIGLMLAIGLAPQIPGSAQSPEAPQAPAPPSVKITFEPGGLVSLTASNISLREILAEWTRKGGTKFNGEDRLASSPMTLQYDHRPEVEVMTSLLRAAAGNIVVPRDQVAQAGTTGVSEIGAVFIVATSTPTSTGFSTQTYTAPQPQYSTMGSPDQEIPPAGPGRSGEAPQPSAPPPAPSRPNGVSPVAVQVVPVSSVPTAGATPTPTPTPTPPAPPSGPGRGGRGGR
ncbi:MAG TPA: hypothetical protein VFV78_10290 [Vicinamibacterales bacterium]|nr:hypothetical protein [Vicinamibacterales bacterium]